MNISANYVYLGVIDIVFIFIINLLIGMAIGVIISKEHKK